MQQRQDKRAGAVREREVEHYLVEQIKLLGGFCPKFVDPSRRGAPDRLVLVPWNPTIYVELKRPIGGEVSKSQELYHKAIRDAGQQVFILWSKPEVDEFLASLKMVA